MSNASIDDVKTAAPGTKIIDIRKAPDDRQIPGSERYNGEAIIENPPFEKDDELIIYCGSGNSCQRVAQALRDQGFKNAKALEGGYAAWKAANLPTEPISEERR